MPNPTVPAAAIGLPTNIVPFPFRKPRSDIEFEPDRKLFEQAYIALCCSWQFAHLEEAGLDRALEQMIKEDGRRHGTIRMVRENAEAIRFLYEATDFLIEADTRMQASLARVLTKLEAK